MLEIDEPGEKPSKGELLAPYLVLAYAARSSDAAAFFNLTSNKRQKSRSHGPPPPPPVPARRIVLRLSGKKMVSRKRTAVL
jgi:hypothetical protein